VAGVTACATPHGKVLFVVQSWRCDSQHSTVPMNKYATWGSLTMVMDPNWADSTPLLCWTMVLFPLFLRASALACCLFC